LYGTYGFISVTSAVLLLVLLAVNVHATTAAQRLLSYLELDDPAGDWLLQLLQRISSCSGHRILAGNHVRMLLTATASCMSSLL
jgi:hypothetical protein